MRENSWMSQAQWIRWNPILLADADKRKAYAESLRKQLALCRASNPQMQRWTAAAWQIYEAALAHPSAYQGDDNAAMLPAYVPAFQLLDLFALTGGSPAFFPNLRKKRLFHRLRAESGAEPRRILDDVHSRFLSPRKGKKRFARSARKLAKPLETYLGLAQKTLAFQKRRPLRVLVTGLMSAGKSTFLNALLGRKILPMQNLACTSKIHALVNKPYEDGYIYEDDCVLVLDAGERELFADDPQNANDFTSVGLAFHGGLAGERVVLYDSPGVNASTHEAHRDITAQFLAAGGADVILYVMNFTQLMTDDDAAHARFVCQNIKGKNILFVVNKVDEIKTEESLEKTMGNATRFLEGIGFPQPLVCPVSADAAFFEKCVMAGESMDVLDQMKYIVYQKKLASLQLASYYRNHFPAYFGNWRDLPEHDLLQDSGLAFAEHLIKRMG
ncbi:dynamin family protein [uncultured Selenomonas sp.]|uniref:dynamin family protein n=1 Tax=uncultured Selenomonas sp. TaxID=159275 RepID=UPI0025E4E379|nr:dynamin family protein [uncultured Selenomonas sp.]